ncbi:MAG: metallophosphatase family protein [Lachnospiraceae bacterium]|nr:metallophosphatase family protein [Lachnospiraceae bacterium]
MHRIGIISDTHGLLRPEVAEVLQGCEVILHGGDINNPDILDKLNQIAPTYAVRGNNDKEWAKDLPETLSLKLYGINFFMVHNKKHIPQELKNVDIIIYGHSHKYEEKSVDGHFMMNPGSCGPRRFTQPITFAVLEVEDDCSYRVEKIEIAHMPKRAKSDIEEAEDLLQEVTARDTKKLVKSVMRDTDKKLSVEEIAVKNGISKELAEQICRLYLTHPGVSADGILGKMGL